MAKHIIVGFILFVILFGCNKAEPKDQFQFKVGQDFVGYVTDTTQIKDLRFIFKNDSIVNRKEDDSFVGGLNPFEIYEKNGNHLLSVFPTDALDSLASIDYIFLIDKRYKTAKGISNQSYFIDLKNSYKISEIKNELNTLTIKVDSINATFLIHKNELNRNFDFESEIDISEIPDSIKIDAFIKHF